MLRRTATYAALYGVAIVLGRATAQPETGLAMMWPAAGVGVLWVLRAASTREVALAATLVGVLSATGNAVTGLPLPAALVLGLSNVVVCVATLRLLGDEVRASSAVAVHRLSHFYVLLAAAGVGTALSAVVGMVGVSLAGFDVSFSAAAGFWLRFMTAIVVITAPALTIGWRRVELTRPVVLEAGLVYSLTIGTVVAVFGPANRLPLAFLPLAFLVWAGLRLPLPLAAAEGGLIAVGALVMLRWTGGGPFGGIDDPQTRTLVLQGFMLLAATLAMVLATVHAELDEVMEGLAASRRRAQESAEDLRVLIADAPYGVVVLATDGRILRANQAMAEMFDCTVADIVGRDAVTFSTRPAAEVGQYFARVVGADGESVRTDWATHSVAGRPLHLALSSRLLTARGGEREILVNVADVSERRRYEERLAHLAATDALTGLPNRRRFEEVMARHQAQCEATGQQGALLLIDLDHFKEVNDTLGHAAGDHLIKSVGSILRDVLRASDTVARLGGDEFAVLLPDADAAAAEAVAAAVVSQVRGHCGSLEGVLRRVTASVGVVTFEVAAQRGADVLALADVLMYDAKDLGRDGYAMVDSPAPTTVATRPMRVLSSSSLPEVVRADR